jgi:hypothetical protein
MKLLFWRNFVAAATVTSLSAVALLQGVAHAAPAGPHASKSAGAGHRDNKSLPYSRPLTKPPAIRSGENGYSWATWEGHDSKVMFSRYGTNGVTIHQIDRDRERTRPGSGGQLLAEALNAAGIPQPTIIRGTDIVNYTRVRGAPQDDDLGNTVLGTMVKNAASALGGKVIRWEKGITDNGDDEFEDWVQATVEYSHATRGSKADTNPLRKNS